MIDWLSIINFFSQVGVHVLSYPKKGQRLLGYQFKKRQYYHVNESSSQQSWISQQRQQSTVIGIMNLLWQGRQKLHHYSLAPVTMYWSFNRKASVRFTADHGGVRKYIRPQMLPRCKSIQSLDLYRYSRKHTVKVFLIR